VRFEASTTPSIHNLIHEFLINMAFTMACPNFKKGLKMAFGPLGVKSFPSLEQPFLDFLHCTITWIKRYKKAFHVSRQTDQWIQNTLCHK
jgi:hypothetical protein